MTDVLLHDREQIVEIQAFTLQVKGADFELDSAQRRIFAAPQGSTLRDSTKRRALVHNANDTLAINFNKDYRGGVTVEGVTEFKTGVKDFTIFSEELWAALPLQFKASITDKPGLLEGISSPTSDLEFGNRTPTLVTLIKYLFEQLNIAEQKIKRLEDMTP